MNRSGFGYEVVGMNAIVRRALAGLVAAGLGVDAYTHLDLASNYRYITTGTVNQGVLFQIEGVSAIAVGVLVLIRPALLSAIAAAALAGGGAAVLLIYRYVSVGKIGPIPDMSEPVWFHEKVVSFIGELVAFGAAGALVAICLLAARRPSRRSVAAAA